MKRSAIATSSPELLRYPPFFWHLFNIIDVIFRILQLFWFGEIFCMDDKYHYEIWTNTLEVSLGWSLSLSILGHFCDILSSISLYGTNFFKFHLFPSNKKIKQFKQSTNDWCNDNENHDITFGFKMLLIAGEGIKNKDDYRELIDAYCNFSHNCSNWTINYFVTSIIIINIKSKQ